MRRIISLWFPRWPIDCWRRQKLSPNSAPSGDAFVLTEADHQTQKLYAVCDVAGALGLSPGMTLAEARAIRPSLTVAPAAPDQDSLRLDALARWLVRYTPLVATDGRDGILLDVTGCAHLFGGEKAMLAQMQNRITTLGFTVQVAMAENRAAAWALARYRPGTISANERESHELLSPLPVAALKLDSNMVQTLGRLGLKTIGQLLDLPRANLARRFRGSATKQVTALLTALDNMFGHRDTSISPLGELPNWQVRQAFAEPAQHQNIVEITTQSLVQELCAALARAEQGALRLSLAAYRVDGTVQYIQIGTNKPSRDAAHLTRLLLEKIPTLEAGFGFDLLVLKAFETERLAPTQLGHGRQVEEKTVAELLDRLAVRLGPGAVSKIKHRHSHLPERTQTFAPVGEDALGWSSVPMRAPRPLRLLRRPEQIDVLAGVPEDAPRRFRWRRVEHRVVKAAGPERMAPEWWLEPDQETRDYYRVEVTDGARFWLFRYGTYPVPGLPQRQTHAQAEPCWYMHGFFA